MSTEKSWFREYGHHLFWHIAVYPAMGVLSWIGTWILLTFYEPVPSWNRSGSIRRGIKILSAGSRPCRLCFDPTGIERKEIRARWWDESATTYRKAGLVPEAGRDRIPDLELPETVKLGNDSGVPTFLGHYWMTGTPCVQNPTLAVLDFGAAKVGPLVAYRWSGEDRLMNDNIVFAEGGF